MQTLEKSSITYNFRSFKMKKQLLIAAVAATMTTVSMADISITGGAKINYTNTDYELERLLGKCGKGESYLVETETNSVQPSGRRTERAEV
jgi:hypothetical protein